MPPSTSVFGKFKRHTQDVTSPPPPPPTLAIEPSVPAAPTVISEEASPTATTASAISEPERNRLQGHRRESSILSLGNSVSDLRRSVSLRSHRSQPSTSTYAHKPRMSSSLTPSPDSGPGSPLRSSRARNNLSISTHFNRQNKSTENIHSISPPTFDSNPSIPVPPLTAAATNHRNPFSMLAGGAPSFKRHASDRPSLGTQSSFGAPLQHAPTLPTPSAGSQNPLAIYTHIHETAAKRIATIEYLKRVHSGDIYYFNTLHYNAPAIASLPSMNPHKLGRRSTSYVLLGYSMPGLLDLNSGSPLEYLKALSALLQEFETYQTLSGYDSTGSSLSRGRMGQMFKSGMGIGLGKGAGKGRRASATTDSIVMDAQHANLGLPPSAMPTSSPQDLPFQGNPITHDFQHLLTPHLPFDPDFGTTLATLCDTLVETYQNLLGLVNEPDTCNTAVGDAFSKADKSVRKLLVANVVRDFEDSTRAGVKGEVAGLGRLVLGGLM